MSLTGAATSCALISRSAQAGYTGSDEDARGGWQRAWITARLVGYRPCHEWVPARLRHLTTRRQHGRGADASDVQSNVSSPLRDHPAIHAQRTGSSAHSASMPSQPLIPDLAGDDDLAKAGKDEDPMAIEPDLRVAPLRQRQGWADFQREEPDQGLPARDGLFRRGRPARRLPRRSIVRGWPFAQSNFVQLAHARRRLLRVWDTDQAHPAQRGHAPNASHARYYLPGALRLRVPLRVRL